MNHKKYTISSYYTEKTVLFNFQTGEYLEPLDGYNTISEILEWCDNNNVHIDTVLVTEWNLDNIDEYGIPDISEQNNLYTLIK